MNINKLQVKATQVNIIEKMESSHIVYNDMDSRIVDLFQKLATSEDEKKELMQRFNTLKLEDGNQQEKEAGFKRIKAFLMKHSSAIGDSIAAATLFEYLSKMGSG